MDADPVVSKRWELHARLRHLSTPGVATDRCSWGGNYSGGNHVDGSCSSGSSDVLPPHPDCRLAVIAWRVVPRAGGPPEGQGACGVAQPVSATPLSMVSLLPSLATSASTPPGACPALPGKPGAAMASDSATDTAGL